MRLDVVGSERCTMSLHLDIVTSFVGMRRRLIVDDRRIGSQLPCVDIGLKTSSLISELRID